MIEFNFSTTHEWHYLITALWIANVSVDGGDGIPVYKHLPSVLRV